MVAVLLGFPKEALLKPLPKEVTPLKTSAPLTCPSRPSPSCSLLSHLHPPLASTRPRGAVPVESQFKLSLGLGSAGLELEAGGILPLNWESEGAVVW